MKNPRFHKQIISPKNVTISRGGRMITSFLGAFGNDLKETRLTAAIGYLIALAPDHFYNLFRLKEPIYSVCIEEKEEFGRVDIKIQSLKNTFALEAKINSNDPFEQSKKYSGKNKILLSKHIPSSRQKQQKNVHYINWNDVHKVLLMLTRKKDSSIKFLSSDIIKYLKLHNMIKNEKPTEIYIREINEEVAMNMFFKSHFYCCDFKKNSNLYSAIYFAPHFGMRLEQEHAGINSGISHIARIKNLEIVEDWKHFIEVLTKNRGKVWVNKNMELLQIVRRNWKWGINNRKIVFFLAEPINAFNPPINKTNIQAGKGWLSKTFLSFDELFKARSEKIYNDMPQTKDKRRRNKEVS